MRRVTTIVLLMVSMSAAGADDVYYCADTAGSGFYWRDGRYKPGLFIAKKFEIQPDGMQVKLKGLGDPFDGTYGCENIWQSAEYSHSIICRLNAALFNYNSKTGHYVRIKSTSWLSDAPSLWRDNMNVIYGTCDKFD